MWNKVCQVDDIPLLGARVIERQGNNIAVFRTSNGIFAVVDKCPHRGGPLSQGIVHGCQVNCPLHGWIINLDTGIAKEPDEGRTKCFKTKVENNTVFIDIDD